MRNLFLYASAVAFTFAGVCTYAARTAPQAAELESDASAYSLVIERGGQAYVADYDLTFADCYDAMMSLQHIKAGAWPSCERQPQGMIGE